jgi:hypothetical protein
LEAGSVPPNLNFPQLDFVKPSNGFHPVTWERVTHYNIKLNFIAENKIFHIKVLIVVGVVCKVKQHVANNCIDDVPVDIKNYLALSAQ